MRNKMPSSTNVLQDSEQLNTVLGKSKQLIKMRDLISSLLPLELQSQCQVANYRNGILILYTTSPTWSSRLRLLLPKLMQRLHLVDAFEQLEKIEIKVRQEHHLEQKKQEHHTLSEYGRQVLDDIKQQIKSEN